MIREEPLGDAEMGSVNKIRIPDINLFRSHKSKNRDPDVGEVSQGVGDKYRN